jgi:hypothetical protein
MRLEMHLRLEAPSSPPSVVLVLCCWCMATMVGVRCRHIVAEVAVVVVVAY